MKRQFVGRFLWRAPVLSRIYSENTYFTRGWARNSWIVELGRDGSVFCSHEGTLKRDLDAGVV